MVSPDTLFKLPNIQVASIVLPMPMFWLMVAIIVGLVIILAIMVLGGRDVPSIGEMKKARRKKTAAGRIHFPDGNETTITLEPEMIGGNDLMNKTIGQGKPTNYHRANGLIKFWDSTGQAAERIDGIIPVYNLLMNIPEPVAVRWAAILDALEKELSNAGYALDGIQDLFFYCLKELDEAQAKGMMAEGITKPLPGANGTITPEEADKYLTDIRRKSVQTALDNVLRYVQVHDEASKDRVRRTIEYLYDHSDEINYRLNRPIPYTWQSLIRAWDALQGVTSRNVEQIKICAEEEARLDLPKKDTSILMYALAFCAVIGVLFFVSKAAGWI